VVVIGDGFGHIPPAQTGKPVSWRIALSPLDDIPAGKANNQALSMASLGNGPRVEIRGDAGFETKKD